MCSVFPYKKVVTDPDSGPDSRPYSGLPALVCPASVKGSSILETVISMTILLTILTLTFIRVDNVNASVNPQIVYRAHLATNRIMVRENLLVEEQSEFEVEGYHITKQLQKMNGRAYSLRLDVYNGSGRLLYTRYKILANGIDL